MASENQTVLPSLCLSDSAADDTVMASVEVSAHLAKRLREESQNLTP
jgi:hypothetical protein